MFIKIVKLQIDYVHRVMQMPDHRLSKIIAIQMLRSQRGYFKEWKDLAEGCGVVLNLNLDELSNWRSLLYGLINQVDLFQRAKHEEEAAQSLHRMIYNRLNYRLNENNYFNDKNNTNIISLMFHLRGEFLQLNYMPHRSDLPILCDLCNRREREDIIHFLGRCPVLSETRRSIFGCGTLSEDYCLSLLNEMDTEKLFEYLQIALNYRSRIRNGDF